MELADLNEDERVALVALLERVVAADRDLTEDEEMRLGAVIEALGDDYERAVETAEEKLADDAELKRFLERITRQEPRELIYTAVMDVALADAVMAQEAPLLEWLAKTWGIDVKMPAASA